MIVALINAIIFVFVLYFFYRMVHLIAAEFLTDERDRKYYADHYTCCPPPLFIILITFIEVSSFTILYFIFE